MKTNTHISLEGTFTVLYWNANSIADRSTYCDVCVRFQKVDVRRSARGCQLPGSPRGTAGRVPLGWGRQPPTWWPMMKISALVVTDWLSVEAPCCIIPKNVFVMDGYIVVAVTRNSGRITKLCNSWTFVHLFSHFSVKTSCAYLMLC